MLPRKYRESDRKMSGQSSAETARGRPRSEASSQAVLAAAHLEMLQTCVERGADAVDWLNEAATSPLAVLETARLEAGGPRHRCAADGFSALAEAGPPAYAWSALLGLQSHLVATGRIDEARATVDGAVGFSRKRPCFTSCS